MDDFTPGMHSHAAQMGWYTDGPREFFVNYTVINGTQADNTGVNGASVDVGAMSYRDGVTLTDAEVAALCATLGYAVIKDGTGVSFKAQVKRNLATAMQFLNPLA